MKMKNAMHLNRNAGIRTQLNDVVSIRAEIFLRETLPKQPDKRTIVFRLRSLA